MEGTEGTDPSARLRTSGTEVTEVARQYFGPVGPLGDLGYLTTKRIFLIHTCSGSLYICPPHPSIK